jgi:8-oxo-dGTP pyrophosphatase MutT (NUDIX family)
MGISFTNAYWIAKLEEYQTLYEEEKAFKAIIIRLLETHSNCFERSLLSGHITASAFIVDLQQTQVLLLHHTKLNRWLQPGGHADGDKNLFEVAKKEVLEETGIKILEQDGEIFDIDIHTIPAKKEIPEHEHFDIRFLFKVDKNTLLNINHESQAIKWVKGSELKDYTEETSINRMWSKLGKDRDQKVFV